MWVLLQSIQVGLESNKSSSFVESRTQVPCLVVESPPQKRSHIIAKTKLYVHLSAKSKKAPTFSVCLKRFSSSCNPSLKANISLHLSPLISIPCSHGDLSWSSLLLHGILVSFECKNYFFNKLLNSVRLHSSEDFKVQTLHQLSCSYLMIHAVRFIRLLHFPIPFTSGLPSNQKWVSSMSRESSSTLPNHPQDHLRLFFESRRNQKNPTCEYALVSALKECTSQFSVCQGEQIHSLVLKLGLESNIFIQNSLINLHVKCGRIETASSMFNSCLLLDTASWNIMIAGYVKLGRLEEAHWLFEKMPGRDCVSFTTMIMGLAQNNNSVEALEVFKEMRVAGVTPNDVTLASLITAYLQLGGIPNGNMLHALVIKTGLEVFTLVSTNLIHMYLISLRLHDAKTIFSEMPERNVVSWNVMLNGYSKMGLIEMARDLFEKAPVRDLVSWSTIIDGYVRADRLDGALVMYREMKCAGLNPSEVTVVDLVSACGRKMVFDEGQQLHCTAVKSGLDCYEFMQSTLIYFYAACHKIELACLQFELACKENIASWNALIGGFIRNNRVDLAKLVFNDMPRKDVVSWSSMISGYAQMGLSDSTVQLFHEMLASGVQPNEITMVSLLSSIANSGTLSQGKWVHYYIRDHLISPNENLSAALIDMYAKCGSISSAFELFYQVKDRSTSISPWNAAICGLAMHGHAEKSLGIFSDLQNTDIRPNSITFIGVLSACCHAGFVAQGEWYFHSMKRVYGIEPNIKHYGCMVDLLGRDGRLEEAEILIKGMPMKADVIIWGTLLAASRTHGNLEIGERAAESLASLDPDHGAGRVLLSNIYADAERWDDVFLVRRNMDSERMKKSPGCSGVA